MPTLQVFDRINRLDSEGNNLYKLRSMPYEQYFGEMAFLSDEEKEERIALAEDLEDVMMFLMFLVVSQSNYSYMAAISSAETKETLRQRMVDTVSNHVEIDGELQEQINDFIDEATDTTFEYLVILNAIGNNASTGPIPTTGSENETDAEFYLSDDRARLLAEEESNSIFNYMGFEQAVMRGYRTKTWLTMADAFVRRTHVPMEGKTIPIDELFQVGDSFMRFPRDQKYNARLKEIVRCRCGIKYNK